MFYRWSGFLHGTAFGEQWLIFVKENKINNIHYFFNETTGTFSKLATLTSIHIYTALTQIWYGKFSSIVSKKYTNYKVKPKWLAYYA